MGHAPLFASQAASQGTGGPCTVGGYYEVSEDAHHLRGHGFRRSEVSVSFLRVLNREGLIVFQKSDYGWLLPPGCESQGNRRVCEYPIGPADSFAPYERLVWLGM